MSEAITMNTGAIFPSVGSSSDDSFFLDWIKRSIKDLVTSTQEVKALETEVPTQYLLDSLKESEAEYKAGNVTTFGTGQDALNYLDEEISHESKKK